MNLGILPFEPEVVKEGDAGDMSFLDNYELPITREFHSMVDEILKLPEEEKSSPGQDKVLNHLHTRPLPG